MDTTSTSFDRQLALLNIARRVLTLRTLFIAVVLYGGLLFWIAPRPPMVDIPQHAGQIATLHDMLLGSSPWQALLTVNLFTPYLVGYGMGVVLSFVMPTIAAVKLMLTLSYYTFVIACVLLRRRFGGDARLDWLFVPGFFGLTWQWGFYTFLVAVPLGLLYLLLALRHADRPSLARASALLLAGVALFFAHGLVFLLANAIGVMFLVVRGLRIGKQGLAKVAVALAPYAGFALLCMAYVVLNHSAQTAYESDAPVVATGQLVHRIGLLLVATWGAGFSDKWPMVMATLLVLVVVQWLGVRLNRREPAAFVPLGVLLIYWFLVPTGAMSTAIIYERFALYALPFYALLFGHREQAGKISVATRRRGLACQVALALICIVFFGIQTNRIANFAVESADFEQVLDAAEPGERALMLTMDSASPAAGNSHAYMHYAAWYQAEKQGFVDFNFAEFMPQIIRYRHRDAMIFSADRLAWLPATFSWERDHGENYRYFFVRGSGTLPPALLTNPRCPLSLVEKSGSWSLYENRHCRNS
jgi:hypothetical protein